MNQADFARLHGVSRKTVTAWKHQGRIVMRGANVDVQASEARLRDAGLGRFRDLAACRTYAHRRFMLES